MAEMAEQGKGIAELTRKFIESSAVDFQNNLVVKIAKLVNAPEANGVFDVVEALGLFLASEETSQRKKGTQLLAELMHRLIPNCLNKQETDLLTMFFIDRLKDHHSIQPQVIYGLLGLVSYHNVADDHIVKICQTIFAEVHVRSLVQADRRNVFNLYSNMLEKYCKPLQRMGPDFVLGFIQGMDGEKDPRNLLVCFQDIEHIISKLQFEVFAEDMFEVTSCYFPIDFTPPQNDPYGVTKEELILSLRSSLSATRVFAPFLLPLLMEKASSDIIDAKIDALLTMASCVQKYKPEDIFEYRKEMWSMLRRDYLLGGLKRIEEAGLGALKNVIICLSGNFDVCLEFVDTIIQDCMQALKDPDLNIPEQLGLVFLTVIYSCPEVFGMVSSKILKFLVSMLNEKQTQLNLVSVMQIINKVLGYPNLSNEFNIKSVMQEIQGEISGFLLATLSSTEDDRLICSSMSCLLEMLNQGLLPQEEAVLFIDNILLQLKKCPDASKVLTMVFWCISKISERNQEPSPGYFSKILLKDIHDFITNADSSSIKSQMTLNNLLKGLFFALHGGDVKFVLQCMLEIVTVNFHSACKILEFIIKIINKHISHILEIESVILPQLTNLLDDESAKRLLSLENGWNLLLELLRTLFCSISNESQENWLKQIVLDLLPVGFNGNTELVREEAPGLQYRLLTSTMKIALLNAFVCGLRQSVVIPKLSTLLKWLQKQITDAEDINNCQYGCKMYASIINKLPEGETLDMILKELIVFIDALKEEQNVSRNREENIVLLILWVCKGIILRWHKEAPIISSRLVSLLLDRNFGKHVGDHFSVLVKEDNDCLNEKMHAIRKMMYKQRFVEFILPKLVAAYKNAEEIGRGNVSKAIAHLFQHLPKKILQKQLHLIIPLLIRSLSFSDPVILSSSLATFNSLESPAALKEHVTSLIPRLLSLAKAPGSMNLRIQAILCLKFLCGLPMHSIYPYQQSVIRSLKACLNDKKRLVRKEACRCRNHWYLLKGDN